MLGDVALDERDVAVVEDGVGAVGGAAAALGAEDDAAGAGVVGVVGLAGDELLLILRAAVRASRSGSSGVSSLVLSPRYDTAITPL